MKYNFADRVTRMESSDIRELMKISTNQDIIAFGAGSPAKSLFPINELRTANDFVYSDTTLSAFQYANSEGYEPLRTWIAERHNAVNNTHFSKENILITNGSQQGIDLVAKIFLNKGDIVLCERPTYVSALSVFKSYECEFLDVEMDSEGMILDEVENLVSKHHNIKIIYIIPNYQNPTGTTWSKKRRKAIAQIASNKGIVVVEDDPYRELGFTVDKFPSMSALGSGENIITLGSFSKSLCPGLRIGWLIANEEVLEKIVYAKQATDLQTNGIVQRQIYTYLEMNDFNRHLLELKKNYKHRCDIAYESICEFFPKKIKCNKPTGGLFLWIEVPEYIDTKILLPEAIKRGVAYVPGYSFYAKNPKHNNLRINFSSVMENDLRYGIKLLGLLLKEMYC